MENKGSCKKNAFRNSKYKARNPEIAPRILREDIVVAGRNTPLLKLDAGGVHLMTPCAQDHNVLQGGVRVSRSPWPPALLLKSSYVGS
jgi:hypothetical protein